MGVSLKNFASHGRNGDTEAIHVNKREIPAVDLFLRALGGAGTRNPTDGGLEYYTESRDRQDTVGGGNRQATGGPGAGGRTGSGRTDRDQQSNRVADAAQSAANVNGGRTEASGGNGPGVDGSWSSGAPAPDAPPGPGGGTYTSWSNSPGAVENHPDANAAAVADMLSNAVPGVGALNTTYKAGKLATGDGDLSANNFGPLGDALGANAGPQRGWAPDRSHGAVNPFSSQGSAQGSPLRHLRIISALANPLDPAAFTKTYSSSSVVS
jgi:hypothetical protein